MFLKNVLVLIYCQKRTDHPQLASAEHIPRFETCKVFPTLQVCGFERKDVKRNIGFGASDKWVLSMMSASSPNNLCRSHFILGEIFGNFWTSYLLGFAMGSIEACHENYCYMTFLLYINFYNL